MTGRACDPFAGLYPPGIEDLEVAWRQLRVPGPPPGLELSRDEADHPDPHRRVARRTVQYLTCGNLGARGSGPETLALVDKASPHSLWDLMLSEVSPTPSSTAAEASPLTGRTLWLTGLEFVRFCSRPDVAEAYGLAGGDLHLALNCDPYTTDRESVQAAKQLHLHLLCWDAASLRPLVGAEPLRRIADRRLRRQALDPLTFLGARLATETLADLDLGVPGAVLLAPDDEAVLRGERPLGCVLSLPGWEALGTPAFEDLVRRIHGRLESLAGDLLHAFVGRRDPPPPWRRHPPLPYREILGRLSRLDLSDRAKAGLGGLARVLRGLDPATARRLAGVSPERRRDLMTLNQPCYALSLHAPHPLPAGCPFVAAPRLHLIVQPKLFSGIGGAGLLTLGGVASVRVLRGCGTFEAGQWERRARFQRAFARFNLERLAGLREPDLRPGPVRRYAGPLRGWVD